MRLAVRSRLVLWFACLVCVASSPLAAAEVKWAIALHGGAGNIKRNISEERREEYNKALTEALRVGANALKAGESALDATQKAVMVLEDCPLFNAGRGSIFDQAGGHALDASIMDGRTLQTGGVTGVTNLRNPIHAARIVMEKTPHILFRGTAAEELAASHGATLVPKNYFSVPFRFEKLQGRMRKLGLEPPSQPQYGWPDDLAERSAVPTAAQSALEEAGGTVGCVALDVNGGLAAATSTGGRNAKMVGRVGDSPVPGAGNYANPAAAVGGTGKGEEFLRFFVTGRVALLVESGQMSLDQAVRHCLENVLQPGDGGMIAVDKDGNLSLHTTTGSMSFGAADSSGRFETGIWLD